MGSVLKHHKGYKMPRIGWNLCCNLYQKVQWQQSIKLVLLSRRMVIKPLFSISCRQHAIYNRTVQDIGIVGAPLREGQGKKGVEHGPAVLREYGLVKRLKDLGHNVEDYGDIVFDKIESDSEILNAKKAAHIGAATNQIFRKVSEVVKSGRICLTLGGDHSMAIGSVLGHCSVKPKTCVLFVDAHADINTPATTVSGNMHGMAVSFFIKEMQKHVVDLPGFEWVKSGISKNNIAYIALRSVDPPERKFLEDLNIKYYSMRDVDRWGIFRVINHALENINPCGDFPLHVSFDIDALDSEVAPSTGTAVPGGLTLREAIVIAEEVARTGALSAMDMVEVNPTIASEKDVKKTVSAALDIICSMFYNERAGNIFKNATAEQ